MSLGGILTKEGEAPRHPGSPENARHLFSEALRHPSSSPLARGKLPSAAQSSGMRETASSVSVFPAKPAARLTGPVIFLALQLSQIRHLQATQCMLGDWALETVSPSVEPWFISTLGRCDGSTGLGATCVSVSSGPLLQPLENCRETSLYRVWEKGKPSMSASFMPFRAPQDLSYAGPGFCRWGVLRGRGSRQPPRPGPAHPAVLLSPSLDARGHRRAPSCSHSMDSGPFTAAARREQSQASVPTQDWPRQS